MRIFYIGNYAVSHSTESHVAWTLEDMGHDVYRCQEDEIETGTLLRDVEDQQPELVLWTRTWGDRVKLQDLEVIRTMGIPSASFHLDLYVGISREATLDHDPFWRTDYVFTVDGDPQSAKLFAAKGINHHWIKPGVYKPECVPGQARTEYTGNVAFIGATQDYHVNDWPYRRLLHDFLRDTYGRWYRAYGHPYKGVRGQDLNDVFASTKVIVGDTLCPNFTHQNYWSDRVYETTGRGGFIIHPRIVGLETEFTEGEEIAYYNYGDFDHLKRLIDWYIEHDDYREAVRLRGHNRTAREHTYHNRMHELLGVINGL